MTIRSLFRGAVPGAMLAAACAALAQSPAELATAEQVHERQVARCNDGSLPAPAREACVRQAGAALDRARGGPPSTDTRRSGDGRSTVVTPEGASPPSGSDTVRSGDGRSTVVTPLGAPAPAGSEAVRSNDGRSTVVQPAR